MIEFVLGILLALVGYIAKVNPEFIFHGYEYVLFACSGLLMGYGFAKLLYGD